MDLSLVRLCGISNTRWIGTDQKAGAEMSEKMKPLTKASGVALRNGWILSWDTVNRIREQAAHVEDVSMEGVEAVALAMADLGYAEVSDD